MSKKKKKKKAKKKVISADDQEQLNQKYIEELEKKMLEKQVKCHAPSGSSICGMKINILSMKCKFCATPYCGIHLLPEDHGCGEKIIQEEREQHFEDFKNAKFVSPKSNLAYLKQKAKKQMNERQTQRKK